MTSVSTWGSDLKVGYSKKEIPHKPVGILGEPSDFWDFQYEKSKNPDLVYNESGLTFHPFSKQWKRLIKATTEIRVEYTTLSKLRLK